MENALVWMFGIIASIIAVAYIAILAAVLAAKRRMSTPLEPARRAPQAQLARVHAMRYRTP